MTISEPVHSYIRFFETLSPATLHQLDMLVTEDVVFRDPFNDVRGLAAMRRVFDRMFTEVSDARFSVSAAAQQGDLVFLRWRFTGRTRGASGAPLVLEGVSEIQLADDGRISRHIDYWDAAELYERLPLVGWVLRRLRRRLSA